MTAGRLEPAFALMTVSVVDEPSNRNRPFIEIGRAIT